MKIKKPDYISFEKTISKHSCVMIYGAGVVASSIYTALRDMYHIDVKCFVVTSIQGNPAQIDGIPVKCIDDIDGNLLLIAAIPLEHHNPVKNELTKRNINNVTFIAPGLEFAIMSEYFKSYVGIKILSDIQPNTADKPDLCIYMAKSVTDKPLLTQQSVPDYITPLQAGAALTGERVAKLTDDTGDNISLYNRNYCELTALYWAWKNGMHEYTGLCHYRRWFLLDQNNIKALYNVDAVLPLPSVYYPDITVHQHRYISNEDWTNVLKVMQAAGYGSQIHEIMHKQYMYNYNLLVAKKAVFEALCEWMFPLLKEIRILCEANNPDRNDRYIGYIGELLTTFYFMHNSGNLEIAHGEKTWLI